MSILASQQQLVWSTICHWPPERWPLSAAPVRMPFESTPPVTEQVEEPHWHCRVIVTAGHGGRAGSVATVPETVTIVRQLGGETNCGWPLTLVMLIPHVAMIYRRTKC